MMRIQAKTDKRVIYTDKSAFTLIKPQFTLIKVRFTLINDCRKYSLHEIIKNLLPKRKQAVKLIRFFSPGSPCHFGSIQKTESNRYNI